MYREYSALQAKQLRKLPFADTQSSTYLLLYAPGRRVLLEQSLACQHHQKFRLVTELPQTLNPAVSGVVLVAEDTQLLPPALSTLASALAEGADLVTCDAAFDLESSTTLYYSEGAAAHCRLAVVSPALLVEARTRTGASAAPAALIAAAAEAAQAPRHLPLALISHRRELQPDDIFSSHGRRCLVLCHELSMTGAPIVLVSAIPVLRRLGFEVVVLSQNDKGCGPLFTAAGAALITHPDVLEGCGLWNLFLCCDLILANTVVEMNAIRALNDAPVPVLWWLHDAFAGYPAIAHRIPRRIGENIHVVAVGKHATAAMHSVRPDFEIRQLVYGLPDYAAETFERFDISFAGGKPLFVTVGSFEERKGQDVLVEAIRLLPAEKRRAAAFLFVGKGHDKDLLAQVLRLADQNPENVFYIPRLERGEIKSLMQQCDCVVCSSKDDPMPTFITEGLIFSTPFIVSEHTGTAGLVTEGVNGWVYPRDDEKLLAKAIENAIDHPEQLAAMRPAARKLYEDSFSQKAFEDTLTAYVRELTGEA